MIKIATVPDKFFVTLKGSVLIFIPRDPAEIAAERKLLVKIFNFLKSEGINKKKKDFEIEGIVTPKNGFTEQLIQTSVNLHKGNQSRLVLKTSNPNFRRDACRRFCSTSG